MTGFIVAGGEDELEVDLSDLNALSAGTMEQADAIGRPRNPAASGTTNWSPALATLQVVPTLAPQRLAL